MISDLIHRIKRKLMKLRLQPIRVFCFHQVSDAFDESTMFNQDWMSTPDFQDIVRCFQAKGYTFISLPEAHEKLVNDKFRQSKYAVLTADDGWASLKNILPWLNEQRIPITLFLNPAYLDGKHYRRKETEKYLTEEDVRHLCEQYPLLTIGSHGWQHVAVTMQSLQEFSDDVDRSVAVLKKLPNYIPYFAYTWGWHSLETDNILRSKHIVIVNLKGNKNISAIDAVDRENLNAEVMI